MALLIHINDINDINHLYSIITSITETQINEMRNYYTKYEYLFTYQGMCNYVLKK